MCSIYHVHISVILADHLTVIVGKFLLLQVSDCGPQTTWSGAVCSMLKTLPYVHIFVSF